MWLLHRIMICCLPAVDLLPLHRCCVLLLDLHLRNAQLHRCGWNVACLSYDCMICFLPAISSIALPRCSVYLLDFHLAMQQGLTGLSVEHGACMVETEI